MADEKDPNQMSDADFLKLSEEEAMAMFSGSEGNENDQQVTQNENPDADNLGSDSLESGNGNELDASQSGSDTDASLSNGEENLQGNNSLEGGQQVETPDPEKKDDTQEGAKPDANSGEKGKKTEQGDFKLPQGVTAEIVTKALSFYAKISQPIKADGKEFTVRSEDDLVRLIQQGVNYSRRMNELKPAKDLHRMLKEQNLLDPAKLNLLIDVAKGDKNAIVKLLKDHNVDPMDLDTSGESKYQAKNYEGNPQDNAFRDALESAISTDEGQFVVSQIHKNWDAASKNRLRENPSILGNLLEMQRDGVYAQIVSELEYQRSIGYLTDIPYLQAFDQVGLAMKNAGVFNRKQPVPGAGQMGQLQSNTQQPIASGARKATAPKAVPTPHLSSAPVSKTPVASSNGGQNYDALSDDEFLKLRPPV